MKLNRNFVTPFLTFVFIVVSISGLLMLFHIADGYTEVVHEIMGVCFLVFAVFHIILNWKSIKSYFGKKYFTFAPVFVLVASIGLIVLERQELPFKIIFQERVAKAPIQDVFRFLEIDHELAEHTLKKNGLTLQGAKTIEDLWIINNHSPKEVFKMLIYESRKPGKE